MIAFYYYCTWNHHGKCFQISTNMPSIGLLVSHERGFGIIVEFCEIKVFSMSKPMAACINIFIVDY